MPSGPTPIVKALLILVQCLIWGSTWIVIRGGLRDLPAFTSAAARFWTAGAAMSGAVLWLGRREGGAAPPAWLWLTMGTLNFGLSYGIVYFAETRLPSGLVAVLWAVFPLMMAVGAHLYLPSERLGRRSWLGFALGFLGVVALFQKDVAAFGRGGIAAGLVLLSSPAVSAIGTTLVKRHSQGTSSLILNRNGMFVGATLLTLAAFVTERDAPARWTLPAIASVLYLALFGTALTFGLYFWLMRTTDAHKLSLIAYVTPVVALLLGVTVGGEPFHATTAVGTALVLGSVMLVARPPRRDAQNPVQPHVPPKLGA